MFCSVIIDYAKSLNPKTIRKKDRTGRWTKEFTEFVHLCRLYNIDILSIFDDVFTFTEIIFRVKQDSGPLFCRCGDIIRDSRLGRKYCSINCRSSDKNYGRLISQTKSKLYANAAWKAQTESKKIKTTLHRHGVKFPMQHIDFFLAQQASCFKKDENGLHGYEPYAWPFFKQLYPDLELGTDRLKRTNTIIEWADSDEKNAPIVSRFLFVEGQPIY